MTGTQASVLCEERPCPEAEPTQDEGAITGESEHLSKDCGSWGSIPDGGLDP